MVFFSKVGDGLFSFKCILNLYWNNYFNSVRYFNSGCNVMFSLKYILNHYWNNYFNSGRYFNSGCDVKLSLKFILNHYWNNYFSSGRYFNSGCNTRIRISQTHGQLFCQFHIVVLFLVCLSISSCPALEYISQKERSSMFV